MTLATLTPYKINGSGLSIAPFRFQWSFPVIGTKQNGQPIYSSRYQITADYGQHSPDEVKQLIDAVSAGSFNLTCPDKTSTSFMTFSSVNANIISWPVLVDVHMEPFQIIFNGVI
jgi:hypothetical protein